MKRSVLVLCLLVAAVRAEPTVVALVQDGETKRPVAGALVVSEGSDVMAVTDSAGECVVVSIPKRGGHLLVSRTGYFDARPGWTPPVKPVPDTITVNVQLYSTQQRFVTGRVFDAGTRLTMAGVRVAVDGTQLAETTRADGGFAFSRFPPGPQTLEASFAGFPPKSATVAVGAGETGSVDLYLLDTTNVGSVGGTVFDAGTGKAVSGARVSIEGTGCSALTDSAGSYVIENVPVGTNRVLVSRDGYLNAYTVVRLVKDWAVTVNLYLRDKAPQPARVK
jgi:hypothetical protein